jgi:tetratricopeptide (TPR) repeat protein
MLTAQTNYAELKNFYYHIVTDGGGEDAASLMKELESRFTAFNQIFRIDPSRLSAPLAVRAFTDGAAYNEYVLSRIGEQRSGAVYFHYAQPERCELVIHRKSPGEEAALSHQAFIQYLRAFVPNPPAWIREGFAAYFATLMYNTAGSGLVYEENLAWLDYVKTLNASALDPETVIYADSKPVPDNFQVLSWALVSFFLNTTSENYYRTFAEVFMTLNPELDAAANGDAAARRIYLWNDPATLKKDFQDYLAARKTYNQLIAEGQDAYTAGNSDQAVLVFLQAMHQSPGNYTSYYYLGLLSYEEGDFEAAARYYKRAEELGADKALIQYALGLSSFQAGNYAESRTYLQTAATLDPTRYKERAEELLSRIPTAPAGAP